MAYREQVGFCHTSFGFSFQYLQVLQVDERQVGLQLATGM
jgi:alpha-galactosidase/6-phospho-beta-glucosidase family protein